MNAVSFDSTTLASADYDSATAILELSFRNGSIYRYFAVSESVFQALVAARSKGRFFNTGIKEQFPFVRLAAARPRGERHRRRSRDPSTVDRSA